MKGQREYPPIEGGLIQGVLLVDRLVRPAVCAHRAPSLPGHLIHLVLEGEAEQEVSGQRQRLAPGAVVWYHENEGVNGRILKAPWIYYTVNFTAFRLPPPPFDRRVLQASARARRCFGELWDVWRNTDVPPLIRHVRTLARLMDLLAEVMPPASLAHHADLATHLWWDIEAKIREDLSQLIDFRFLQSLTRSSRHAIMRACHLAVGKSPMKRVKEIRLSYARGLVLYSPLPMTEIALRVGYSRVQELSRDYRRTFGLTPSEDRESGPDYRKQRVRDG
jgi:AraC-like DNA-binding protein